jgi:hypothetical protein
VHIPQISELAESRINWRSDENPRELSKYEAEWKKIRKTSKTIEGFSFVISSTGLNRCCREG